MTKGKIKLEVDNVMLEMDGVMATLTIKDAHGNSVSEVIGKREGLLLGEFLADLLHWWRV